MKKEKVIKTIATLVKILGIFLILFSLTALIIGISYTSSISRMGTTGIRISETESGYYIIKDFAAKQKYYQLSVGDTVVKINGVPYTDKDKFSTFLYYSYNIGEQISFTVLKNGIEETYQVEVTQLNIKEKIILTLFNMIPSLLMMCYVTVGLWGMLRSSGGREIILIVLFCYTFGCFMYGTVNVGRANESLIEEMLYFGIFKEFIKFIMLFAPAIWLLLFSIYPRENKFFRDHKLISYAFIFSIPLLIIITNVLSISSSLLNLLLILLTFAQLILGLVLLYRNTGENATAVEKRKTRLMLLGIKYGIISICLGWATVLSFQIITDNMTSDLMLIALLIFITCETFGLIIPFTFLNSFFGNKLIETESALRRRLKYMVFSLFALGIYMVLIFIIMKWVVNVFTLQDPSVIILAVLMMSLAFMPVNKKILVMIDDFFYPERIKYTEALKSFIKTISGKINISEVTKELEYWIGSTMGIYPVYAVSDLNIKNYPFSLKNEKSILNTIRENGNLYWDEVSDNSELNQDELKWIKENNISLTMPMTAHGELIGILNLGKKKNGEDFTSEDIDLLSRITEQSAISILNLKLQSEYLEKKRIERELQMARKIQERLMPQTIPEIGGLDISASCIPCFEVAGDYHDIIKLDSEKACFIVADVCGKGAGAAIIMANLQASVRVGINLTENIEFTKFIEKLNAHIYSNTSSSEFITLFMAIWEEKHKTIHYVNAGHNPPILIDRSGNVKRLEATGLLLGVLADAKYEKSSLKMEDDSVLVIFTDGLEEATNEEGVQFSAERIIKVVRDNVNLSSDKIIKNLLDALRKHCGTKQFQDDVSLIVIRS